MAGTSARAGYCRNHERHLFNKTHSSAWPLPRVFVTGRRDLNVTETFLEEVAVIRQHLLHRFSGSTQQPVTTLFAAGPPAIPPTSHYLAGRANGSALRRMGNEELGCPAKGRDRSLDGRLCKYPDPPGGEGYSGPAGAGGTLLGKDPDGGLCRRGGRRRAWRGDPQHPFRNNGHAPDR